jgi:hypothetical protein
VVASSESCRRVTQSTLTAAHNGTYGRLITASGTAHNAGYGRGGACDLGLAARLVWDVVRVPGWVRERNRRVCPHKLMVTSEARMSSNRLD